MPSAHAPRHCSAPPPQRRTRNPRDSFSGGCRRNGGRRAACRAAAAACTARMPKRTTGAQPILRCCARNSMTTMPICTPAPSTAASGKAPSAKSNGVRWRKVRARTALSRWQPPPSAARASRCCLQSCCRRPPSPSTSLLGEPRAISGNRPVRGPRAGSRSRAQPDQIAAMAERLVEKLKSTPDDADGWAMLGRTYVYLGRLQEATERLRRSREAAPRGRAPAGRLRRHVRRNQRRWQPDGRAARN